MERYLPKPNETKEDGIPVQHVNDKKYYWCPHHKNEKGKCVIHHPNACEIAHRKDEETPKATVATFNTIEEESLSLEE